MAKLDTLFSRYDKLVIFDTETTGLSPNRDEIIEFSAAVLERQNGEAVVTREYDNLVALSPGRFASPIKTYGSGASPNPVCAGTWRS